MKREAVLLVGGIGIGALGYRLLETASVSFPWLAPFAVGVYVTVAAFGAVQGRRENAG